jgi:cation-dependent mannose-6-phosphate receptor
MFPGVRSESLELQSRGRKLVLQYTGGSPCGSTSPSSRRARARRQDFENMFDGGSVPDIPGGDVDIDDELDDSNGDSDNDDVGYGDERDDDTGAPMAQHMDVGGYTSPRRKSATISFLCDREPGSTAATISFVGTDPEECAYFFEARSVHACAQAEPHKPGSVGPGSVFGLIFVIAVLVYLIGGIFYNRAITHARGWRQLPNYSLWAGMWDSITVRPSQLKADLPWR